MILLVKKKVHVSRFGYLYYGLYQGFLRPGKSFFQGQSLPDRIILFRQPILSICRTKHEIKEQIKKTLIHEIAHHFGLPEARIRHLGYWITRDYSLQCCDHQSAEAVG
ncbi:MAG: metallopeptidase family protein [Deltaproteobacteria bacterium]|nr:metallopeptidase family protein [Deltaproteobacteria bacterium]